MSVETFGYKVHCYMYVTFRAMFVFLLISHASAIEMCPLPVLSTGSLKEHSEVTSSGITIF